uniref:Uncharacterized protein n=1 Tax=Onchocerca volvulus TaxID=6282 RepID=A0A8R1Y4P3_ONCVO
MQKWKTWSTQSDAHYTLDNIISIGAKSTSPEKAEHFYSTFGSSHSVNSTYRKWPTWSTHSMSTLHSSKQDVILIDSLRID